MFHIVIFEKTNEVEVVPSVWIKNGNCMWPPSRTDVAKAVKSQESPGDDWKSHKARIIFTSYDYNEARRKLPQAVEHTDVGSDEDITFKRKRRPKNILFPGEDDEIEEQLKEAKSRKGSYSIPDAPKITRQHNKLHPGKPSCPKLFHSIPDITPDETDAIKGKSRKKRYALPNAPVITMEQISPAADDLHSSDHSTPDLHLSDQSSPDVGPHGQSNPHLRPQSQKSPDPHPNCYYSPDLFTDGHGGLEIQPSQQTSTTGWNVLSESCTSTKSSTEALFRHANIVGSRSVHKSKDHHKKRHSAPSKVPEPQDSVIQQTSSQQIFFLRNILTKQEMIMDQLQIIFKTLQCMQSSQETEMGLDRNLLPIKDLTSLQNMEENLRSTPELHTQLVNTLALKVQECVWRIMHGLFTNCLARKVNMRGLNGKIGFLRLQIRDVVIAAVRRNRLTSEATEKEIDSTVKRWLYLAPDRDGGRKERMKKKELKESTTG